MSYAQRSIRASTAALAYAMEPLFACIFSAIVLKDSIGFVQIAGGALIVSANVLAGIRQTAT
jgi:drug/metabolite transporter (DMT)-like permease